MRSTAGYAQAKDAQNEAEKIRETNKYLTFSPCLQIIGLIRTWNPQCYTKHVGRTENYAKLPHMYEMEALPICSLAWLERA